jgi:hypothetical protein
MLIRIIVRICKKRRFFNMNFKKKHTTNLSIDLIGND